METRKYVTGNSEYLLQIFLSVLVQFSARNWGLSVGPCGVFLNQRKSVVHIVPGRNWGWASVFFDKSSSCHPWNHARVSYLLWCDLPSLKPHACWTPALALSGPVPAHITAGSPMRPFLQVQYFGLKGKSSCSVQLEFITLSRRRVCTCTSWNWFYIIWCVAAVLEWTSHDSQGCWEMKRHWVKPHLVPLRFSVRLIHSHCRSFPWSPQ